MHIHVSVHQQTHQKNYLKNKNKKHIYNLKTQDTMENVEI